MWLKAHEPTAFGAAALALQPRDLVAHALTGEVATDGTHAAATLAFDLRQRAWAADLIAAMDLPADLFPAVRPSSEVLGELLPSVARRVGLSAGVPVVLGGADSQACALGAGVVAAGPVSEMAGSSTCLNAAVRRPLSVLDVTHYPHVVPGPYTTETGINTTGAALAWIADLLYAPRGRRAGTADYARLDAEVATVPPGADGVLALPVLGDGERTDPALRAAFTGLSLRHGRAVQARAMMEGAAFEIRQQLELIKAGGARVTELRVSGGDTRLTSWSQIKADVIGVPVVTVPGDAAVGGVTMLAGLGAGLYSSVDDVIGAAVHLGAALEPEPWAQARYDSQFAAWRELAGAAVVRREG
jgi:sugar (pentulose or hexulose) kinase